MGMVIKEMIITYIYKLELIWVKKNFIEFI